MKNLFSNVLVIGWLGLPVLGLYLSHATSG